MQVQGASRTSVSAQSFLAVLARLSRPTRPRRRRRPTVGNGTAAIELLEDRCLLSATPSGDLFFSLSQTTSLAGIGDVDPGDIVRYDGSGFNFFFRGQDVGLGGANIDAFSIVSDSQLLMSFALTTDVPDVGSVDGADVVRFVADQSHNFSAGTFSLYFDGSDVGLTSSGQHNVVAIDVLENGNLLLSTAGDAVVMSEDGSTLATVRQDLLEFAPSSLGPQTAGSWSVYFDGSDVALSGSTEGIDAVAVGQDGQLFLSTVGSFLAGTVFGDAEDVVEFTPLGLGEVTSGSFVSPLLFNGNVVDPALMNRNINAIEVASIETQVENLPPTAESQNVSTKEDTSIVVQLSGDDGNPDVTQALSFAIVDGPQHGTIVGFDAATGQLEYVPDADFNGTDSFTFVVTDDESVDGEALTSEAAVVSIEVTAVNDAPVNTVPRKRIVGNEDQAILIEGLSIDDVDADAGTGQVMVTLSVQNGTLQVGSFDPSDLTVSGDGSSEVVITGTMPAINSLLAEGITYTGVLNFSGKDWLKVVTSDLENTGEGGALTDTSVVRIKVRSVGEQLRALHRRIGRLVDSGRMNPWVGWWLQATLTFGGDALPLQWRLQWFITSVDVLMDFGLLRPNQHRILTDAANNILESLTIGQCD